MMAAMAGDEAKKAKAQVDFCETSMSARSPPKRRKRRARTSSESTFRSDLWTKKMILVASWNSCGRQMNLVAKHGCNFCWKSFPGESVSPSSRVRKSRATMEQASEED